MHGLGCCGTTERSNVVVSRLAWSVDGLVLAVGLAPRTPDADSSTSGAAAFAISESVRLYTSDGLPLSAVEDEGRSTSSPSTYVSLRAASTRHVNQPCHAFAHSWAVRLAPEKQAAACSQRAR